MISPGFFFIFDIFIFQGVRGVKGQKIAQDDQKILSVELHISGTTHLWSWLMVHMCKRIICSGGFWRFLQILIFGVISGAKKQKLTWNDKKLFLCKHSISE